MSIAIRLVAAAIDGVTAVDLSSGSAPNPATDRYEFTPAAAGLIQLWTLPGLGASEVFIEEIDLVAPGAVIIAIGVALPNNVTVAVSTNPAHNFIIPQGASLSVFASDGINPVAGTISMVLRAVNEKDYHRSQCCHVFAPPFKLPILLTAALPAAGAAQDGRIVIEDAGAGDRNLVFYAGGERFRIDGGAPF